MKVGSGSYNNIAFKANLSQGAAKNRWLVKSCVKFAECGGENLANIVNASSKFAIAPFFIMFNPFSRESSETKKYSALKQPIDAVSTLFAELLLIGGVNKGIDKLAGSGKFAGHLNINKSLSPEVLMQNTKKLNVFKDIVGMFAVIAALPAITSFTNWVYPRVMKKIMPETSGVENKAEQRYEH